MNKRILIVEDDVAFGTMLNTWFSKNSWDATWVSKVELAKQEFQNASFDLVLSDLRLPDGDGIILLTWMRENKIMSPFIIMTSYSDVQTAVLAMKLGAFDYLQKPINPTILQQKIELAMSASTAVEVKNETVKPKNKQKLEQNKVVKGSSAVMQRLYSHIDLVAPTKMSVLILGESGTGKEYIARMIHENSNRKSEPFVAVDCGSLSMELAPSELFGHKKGSFTSAISDKTGVFIEANGGTVFLDEVGNLSYEVQKQLLRALQEQKVRPVGSASDIKVDVRIIAATNEDLEKAIEEGRFRQDLYHRINEFSVNVPPLRERMEDIEEFCYHFIEQANDELGKDVDTIDTEALAVIRQHNWLGNLRELRNVIRRSVLFAKDNVLRKDNLPEFPKTVKTQNVAVNIVRETQEVKDFSLNKYNEKDQIVAALNQARGNKTVAAKLLQIDRKTLYNKMHLYGIEL
ncbi:MAG: sigma-54-dependent Fis family transcriptional regulator [Bacteroidales bacterium]|nr:sigma-54-dependent Fis family transcriptional regulator [Bacteroidales bacterium]MBR5782477.1 sigma-54-dependent Fis family transcriptional regulator [Bacteroidales bacterium]